MTNTVSRGRQILMAEAPIAISYQRYPNGTMTFSPLTPCCHASGKGWESETGVVCRRCFETVDSAFGGFWEFDESPHMVAGYNIAGRWSDYTSLLIQHGITQAKALELTAEAKRQAGLVAEAWAEAQD